ncbi:MAG: superoxide dismutase family protein [Clostridia bacterium]|nr:superoxide dismutase family protein [Clostridia bacterium]
MNRENRYPNFLRLCRQRPGALAIVRGSVDYPDVFGVVRFYSTPYGVLVVTEIEGLPQGNGPCDSPIFAFHIHEGASCTGNDSDPFANVRMHYNPHSCAHPYHAGDLPPLFGAGGYVFSACLTNRFSLNDVIGKTVVIHASLDDFTTQPAGNAGTKIACGEIQG